MRIDLASIDREQFMVHEHIVAGETCFLVQPQHIGAQWDKDNLIFRSSLWNAQGEPVSLSYKKHHNWEECPDIDPAPVGLDGCELMEKIDGSTLLISRYKDELIVRTRGTVDATKMENGDEIALFKERYPRLFEQADERSTFVCEWTSPRNQIVIAYPEPDLYLTGVIGHTDYAYLRQGLVDSMGQYLGMKRPRRYSFNTIPEMTVAVSAFKGVEGICVYYNHGQSWRKCKGAEYLMLHRFKERVTLPNLLDLFFLYNRPDLTAFLDRIASEFDHECQSMARELVTTICNAYNRVTSRYNLMECVVGPLRSLPRRDAAIAIQANYVDVWKGVAFHLLDNKSLDDKTVRKLMEWMLDQPVCS